MGISILLWVAYFSSIIWHTPYVVGEAGRVGVTGRVGEAWSGHMSPLGVGSLRGRLGIDMGGVSSGIIAAWDGCARLATGGVPVASGV
jgi:hypothetical protein